MSSSPSIPKAKAVSSLPAVETSAVAQPSDADTVEAFHRHSDGFALGKSRARANHLTKAATGLDADHSGFSELSQQIALEEAYEKMRQQGRRLPTGITGLRDAVKPPRAKLDQARLPAVPTVKELLDISYTDWINPHDRPRLYDNIRDFYSTKRIELQDLKTTLHAQLQDHSADPIDTRDMLRLVDQRLIELDQESELLATLS